MDYDYAGQPKSYPNYNKANYEAMKEELNSIDWKTIIEDKNVEEAWCSIHKHLETTCKRNVPVFTQKKGKKRPIWMNKTALAKVKKKTRSLEKILAKPKWRRILRIH